MMLNRHLMGAQEALRETTAKEANSLRNARLKEMRQLERADDTYYWDRFFWRGMFVVLAFLGIMGVVLAVSLIRIIATYHVTLLGI